MASESAPARALIEGRPALVVIDIQAGTFDDTIEERSIPHMLDYAERRARARVAIDKVRERAIPVIFIQEVHRSIALWQTLILLYRCEGVRDA